jgi:S-adenosylmethionine:tRNA ribosyltransferase-isomerase
MKLSSIKFDLPAELIASHPPDNREDTRMMVVHRRTGKVEHRVFKDIVEYLGAGDVVVLNNARVFASKLYGNKEKTNSFIEVCLVRELDKSQHLWDITVEPARKIRVGNKIIFGKGELIGEVIDNTTSRGRTLKFFFDGSTDELYKLINHLGNAPIPKALGRDSIPEDKERYQTVYAKTVGAVVAPTAGLPFTNYILKSLELRDIVFAELFLNLNTSIYNVVDIEDITKYKVSSEYFAITKDVADRVNIGLKNKRNICAVGVSVLKAIESVAYDKTSIKPYEGWTNEFIHPKYNFNVTSSLITKFHLSGTVPFINVCAFLGTELTLEVYRVAIENKYKFFVYGDSMLII